MEQRQDTRQPVITLVCCIGCDGDAGSRPYLEAHTSNGIYRYRLCARCMEQIGALLMDEQALEDHLAGLFTRILERAEAARAEWLEESR